MYLGFVIAMEVNDDMHSKLSEAQYTITGQADLPIRVLHLLQRMEPAGVQSFLMNLYRNIDRSKVQFDFLVHYREHQFYDDEIEALGGRIYKFSVREDYNLISYTKKLRQLLTEHKEYSILHGHMETLSGIWMREAARAGIPTRIAHSHTAGFGGVKAGIRELFRHQYPRYATDLFACSEVAGTFMFPGKSYRLIPNAIDTKKFAFHADIRDEVRLELGIDPNALVVGVVGRLHPSKNHSFLIKVMKELSCLRKNSVLLIVGDGEERKHLMSEASNLGVERNVRFLGKRQDVHRLYQAFDIFALPSHFEGMPLVGIEAQASGCPSIFSTGISPETGITDLATFLPINKGPQVWAIRIAGHHTVSSREPYAMRVAAAGFDIHRLARSMEQFYIARSRSSHASSLGGAWM